MFQPTNGCTPVCSRIIKIRGGRTEMGIRVVDPLYLVPGDVERLDQGFGRVTTSKVPPNIRLSDIAARGTY